MELILVFGHNYAYLEGSERKVGGSKIKQTSISSNKGVLLSFELGLDPKTVFSMILSLLMPGQTVNHSWSYITQAAPSLIKQVRGQISVTRKIARGIYGAVP